MPKDLLSIAGAVAVEFAMSPQGDNTIVTWTMYGPPNLKAVAEK